MIRVYRYRAYATWFCTVPRGAIVATFGSVEQFEIFFGGKATFGLSSDPEYLGVWGSRNSSRLRRLIRERLGPIEIVDLEPPSRMTTTSWNGQRLTREQREVFIERLRA